MNSGQDNYPSGGSPESGNFRLGVQIMKELVSADAILGTKPMRYSAMETDGWNKDNPAEKELAEAFHRARILFQGITYGNRDFWQINFNLFELTDPSVFEEEPDARTLTDRLFQLIILSRVEVTRMDDVWSLPTSDDIVATIHEIQREMGLAQDGEQESGFVLFPGTNYETLEEAVLNGTVKMGNPEQPHPSTWNPS